MKKSVRLLIRLAVLVAAVAVFCLISLANSISRKDLMCQGVRVMIAEDYHFVTEQDVEEFIMRGYGECTRMKLDSIELYKIENHLVKQSAIQKCEAYITDDGYLNVEIIQRDPVVRFQKGDYGFYADSEGFIFPLQDNYTSLVPIVDGNVPISSPKGYKGAPEDEKERKWLVDLIAMVRYMQASPQWSRNIVQMHVDERNDLILIPREGNERFIFGAPDELEQKFERMGLYYMYILPAKSEGYYSTVNVKYKGQIVCKK